MQTKYTITHPNADKFLRSIWAGIFIGIGATALMAIQVPIVGSLFFSIGLFTIINLQLSLYTGAIGFLGNRKEDMSPKDMTIIYIGNLIGTFLYGTCLKFSGLGITSANILAKKADFIINLPVFPILFTAFMCGVLMYTGVVVWKVSDRQIMNCIITLLCVSVFILSGFEHCIADMVYLFAGACEAPIQNQIAFLLLVTLGNSLGSIAFHRSLGCFRQRRT